MALLVVLLVTLAVAGAFVIRWARNDGGPRPATSCHDDEWSPDLPSYPYTHRPLS